MYRYYSEMILYIGIVVVVVELFATSLVVHAFSCVPPITTTTTIIPHTISSSSMYEHRNCLFHSMINQPKVCNLFLQTKTSSLSSYHVQQPSSAVMLYQSKNDEIILDSDIDNNSTVEIEKLVVPLLGILSTIMIAIGYNSGYTFHDITSIIQNFIQHPQDMISTFLENIKNMGPIGALYFGLFYLIAETLAVPATPLALSAGYLFGFTEGFTVVLTAATLAACIGFIIGKTYLRTYVEKLLEQNPKFAKLDRAIGERGFKLLVLVRLSPIFPFSISNYIYGASSINFPAYFWGTLLGFIPSTIAYVYTGMVGKEVMFGNDAQPWYVYAVGFGALLTLLKLVTDVATGIIEAIDDEPISTS